MSLEVLARKAQEEGWEGQGRVRGTPRREEGGRVCESRGGWFPGKGPLVGGLPESRPWCSQKDYGTDMPWHRGSQTG